MLRIKSHSDNKLADIVLLIHRPCKYEQDPEHEDETLAILDVVKHRKGDTGEARVDFIKEKTLFTDRERDMFGDRDED